MNSEKVKEIKKALKQNIKSGLGYEDNNKFCNVMFTDILTLINELESEKKTLLKSKTMWERLHTELCKENRELEAENETIKFNMQETEKASFNINQMNGNLVLENQQLKDRLAELEDKVMDGTLIELPCKVGDTVYIATKLWDIKEVVEAEVACIEVTADEKGIRYRTYLDHEYVFSKTNPNLIANRYIFYNDEFFLTKAEAEAKLKELQEEK